jgi:hypothetical protein
VETGRNQINIAEAVDFAWSAYRAHWRLLTGILGAMVGAWVVLAHIAFLLCFAGIEVGLLNVSLALQAPNHFFCEVRPGCLQSTI